MRKMCVHAEVYISAGVVQWRGQEFAPLFEGAERGRQRGERDFGISLYWILDAVRHFGVDEAQRVVDEAIRLKSHNVVGIGIGGDERRAGPEQFREVYEHAANHGLRLTVHAGETVGPESIWGALRELKPDRIGHGLHAIDDPELVRYLAEKQIPVEICITSNVMTGCCAKLEDHPVRKLFDAGVLVTLNTDDPDMFRTTLSREYQIAHDVFGFSEGAARAGEEFLSRIVPAGGEEARAAGGALNEAFTRRMRTQISAGFDSLAIYFARDDNQKGQDSAMHASKACSTCKRFLRVLCVSVVKKAIRRRRSCHRCAAWATRSSCGTPDRCRSRRC